MKSYRIDVHYSLPLNEELDEQLKTAAQEVQGSLTDSGMGFGDRDLGFKLPGLIATSGFICKAFSVGPHIRIQISGDDDQ